MTEAVRYVQAWHLFVGADGELSGDRGAARVTVGATDDGRVRVIVPEGLALAPATAERLAERLTECLAIARNPGARFAPGASEGSDPHGLG